MEEPVFAEARSARCLTEDEIALVRAAAPGQAPPALAHHLAGCARCQEKALFGLEKRKKGGREVQMPSWRGALLLLLLVLTALGGFLYTLQMLAGRIR